MLSTVAYPNIEPGAVDFKGYDGPEYNAGKKKAQDTMKRLAAAPKPPMGPEPETPAQATGRVPAGAPS